ncbi:MAG: hypothetical protein IJI68_00655 [Eggerthellaceae bacterium]|nr:hypothetical protein [Eggerthellaceae bacterium]
MSEIKALERLRDELTKRGESDEMMGLFLHDHEVAMQLIASVYREVDERFVEWPVDAEGVPIRVGDCLQLGDTRGEAVALRCGARHEVLTWEWLDESGDWYYTAFSRHVKSRTLIDVLADFAADVEKGRNDHDTASRYADEIRAMFGEVDHG